MRYQIVLVALVCSAICFNACSTDPKKQAVINAKVGAFFANKTTQQVLAGVTTIGLSAGVSALTQLGATGEVDRAQVASDAAFGAAALLRSLQGTPRAADPVAISAAVVQGAGYSTASDAIAPPVAAAISQAAAKGIAPDVANEQMAKALDKFAVDPAKAAQTVAAPSTHRE